MQNLSTLWPHIEPYTAALKPYYYKALQTAEIDPQLIEDQIRKIQGWNRFEIFLALNGLIIGVFLVIKLLGLLSPRRIWNWVAGLGFKIPIVKRKLLAKLEQGKIDTLAAYPAKHRSQLKKIEYKTIKPDFGTESQLESTKGHLSGSRYPDKKHSDFVISLSKQFSYSNPLHFDLHPYLKQMEVQVLKMCAKMMNFYSDKGDVVGGFFSGGTESSFMAILAYREYGYKYRGVYKPNLVICTTGHAAALKAADLFGIDIRLVKSDSNEQMSVSDTKKNIDHNTICVYTSYPNYPYGTVDPIDEIAYICKKRGVPVHIDMCLGGFLVPFLKDEQGEPMFTVPEGVTSISMDCHKYGLSAKGASVLLFSSEKYRREQLFVTSEWPGGLYGTIGIAGSRSGTMVASAWISMMRLGLKGYTKNANLVSNAVKTLATELRNLGFKVFGEPQICCIGFNHPKYPVSILKQELKKKGWDIPIIQLPIALHYSFTPLNALNLDQLIKAIRQTIAELKAQPGLKPKKNQELEVYGVCAKIPDVASKNLIMKNILDMFLEI